jgi:ribosome-associated protein
VLIIRSSAFRSQKKNREEAVERLHALVNSMLRPPKKRKATKPTKESLQKRKEEKAQRSELKHTRKKVKL